MRLLIDTTSSRFRAASTATPRTDYKDTERQAAMSDGERAIPCGLSFEHHGVHIDGYACIRDADIESPAS